MQDVGQVLMPKPVSAQEIADSGQGTSRRILRCGQHLEHGELSIVCIDKSEVGKGTTDVKAKIKAHSLLRS